MDNDSAAPSGKLTVATTLHMPGVSHRPISYPHSAITGRQYSSNQNDQIQKFTAAPPAGSSDPPPLQAPGMALLEVARRA